VVLVSVAGQPAVVAQSIASEPILVTALPLLQFHAAMGELVCETSDWEITVDALFQRLDIHGKGMVGAASAVSPDAD
jgi:hypothetical protein